eukprot:256245-Prymnesium_polylepis.2
MPCRYTNHSDGVRSIDSQLRQRALSTQRPCCSLLRRRCSTEWVGGDAGSNISRGGSSIAARIKQTSSSINVVTTQNGARQPIVGPTAPDMDCPTICPICIARPSWLDRTARSRTSNMSPMNEKETGSAPPSDTPVSARAYQS